MKKGYRVSSRGAVTWVASVAVLSLGYTLAGKLIILFKMYYVDIL